MHWNWIDTLGVTVAAVVILSIVGGIAYGVHRSSTTARPERCRSFAPEHVGAARAFIVDCARAANPLSDEEGEDLVEQCEATALNLYRDPGPCARIVNEHHVWRCDDVGLPEPVAIACGLAERGPE